MITRLSVARKSNTISVSIKIKLHKALVVSILLYGCESWTLAADTERRIQAFERTCYRKLLRISKGTQEHVPMSRQPVTTYAGEQDPLLAVVKRRKLSLFGHVTRHNPLSKIILRGTLEDGRCRGRQTTSCGDNSKDWTGHTIPSLTRTTEDRDGDP